MAIKARTYGTVEHFFSSRWGDINKRTINGSCPGKGASAKWYRAKGIELRMSREEFRAWVNSKAEIIKAIYAAGDVPSIDRIDSYKHYEINNLQIIPYSENCRKRERSKWKNPPVICCITCGNVCERTTFRNGKKETFKRFIKKKYCSKECRYA